MRITSGLGGAAPGQLVVLPVLFEDRVLGVIELASFTPFSEVHLAFLDQISRPSGSRSTRSSPTPGPRSC